MRRRWTGGSIRKVKIAKRDKTMRQQEYFEKKKGDYGSKIPKRINDSVFQSFVPPAEGEGQDQPSLDKTEAYMSKDYLLLTSRSANKNQQPKLDELEVEQTNKEPTQLDPKPVQMPTTIANDMSETPRVSERYDRVLFIDEGRDRTEEVYGVLHSERLLLVQRDAKIQHHTSLDAYPEAASKLSYGQFVDAELLMREQ